MKTDKKPYKKFGIRKLPNIPFVIGIYFAFLGLFIFLISCIGFLGIQGDISGGAIGTCFGLVFSGAGVAVAVFGKKKDILNKKVKAIGKCVRAQVIGDIINPSVHINGNAPVRLVLKSDDGFSEPIYYLTDDLAVLYGTNNAKGVLMDVYLDNDKYFVDINTAREGTLSLEDAARFGASPTPVTHLPSLEIFFNTFPESGNDDSVDMELTYIPQTPIDEFNPFDID